MTTRNPEGGSSDAFAKGLPTLIQVGVGEELVLALPSAAGGGFTWQVAPVAGDRDVAALELRLGTIQRSDPPTSALAPVTLVVVGRRAGSSSWNIRLARSWQPETPLVAQEIEVVVRA